MSKLLEWFKGKKAYIAMVALFIMGGLQANGIEMPEWIFPIIAGLGLGTLRAAIKKVE